MTVAPALRDEVVAAAALATAVASLAPLTGYVGGAAVGDAVAVAAEVAVASAIVRVVDARGGSCGDV